MDNLHNYLTHLYLFQKVAELGSFQAAATFMNLPRSSVSKKIRQLENHVNQRLILRSTRQLKLTNAGEALLIASRPLTSVLENSHKIVEHYDEIPSGKVKISSSSLIGTHFLLPLLNNIRQDYPNISLELCLSDNYVDLITEKVDIAIRIGHLPDSSLVAREIGTKRWGWFASEGYLAKYGTPSHPDELHNHQCIIFKNNSVNLNYWSFKNTDETIQNKSINSHITTDNSIALVEMACLGLGIIMIDPLFVQSKIQEKTLLPILTDWQHNQTQPINLVCLGRDNRSRATVCIWESLYHNLKNAMDK
jgi:DNA-binding transcriptional LysR family regulator